MRQLTNSSEEIYKIIRQLHKKKKKKKNFSAPLLPTLAATLAAALAAATLATPAARCRCEYSRRPLRATLEACCSRGEDIGAWLGVRVVGLGLGPGLGLLSRRKHWRPCG